MAKENKALFIPRVRAKRRNKQTPLNHQKKLGPKEKNK